MVNESVGVRVIEVRLYFVSLLFCDYLQCFVDEVENSKRTEHMFVILSCIRIKGEVTL